MKVRYPAVLVMLLCALSVYGFELHGCEGTRVNISSVADIEGHAQQVKCHVDREPKGTNLVGWFLPNQDVLVEVGESSMVLRLEQGVLVGVEPEFARPSVRIVCSAAIVQSLIDGARWPDSFDGVREVVNGCSVSARRLVVVPQVTSLLVVFEQVQGVVDLLNGSSFAFDDVTDVVVDTTRLLFAGSHALITFGAQFVGAIP